jgi:hypothetical protein
MFTEIYGFLICGVLAFVLSIVTNALQIMGYIHVNAARWMLFIAWLIGTVGAAASMPEIAPLRHRAITVALVGIPFAFALILLERHASKTVKKRALGNQEKKETPKPAGLVL